MSTVLCVKIIEDVNGEELKQRTLTFWKATRDVEYVLSTYNNRIKAIYKVSGYDEKIDDNGYQRRDYYKYGELAEELNNTLCGKDLSALISKNQNPVSYYDLSKLLDLHSPKPNFWHMQIKEGRDDKSSVEDIKNKFLKRGLIGVGGEKWKNEKLGIDDIIVVRHAGIPLALVQVVGNWLENSSGEIEEDVWTDVVRRIKILSYGDEELKEEYRAATGKNWADGIFASTTLEQANNWHFIKWWYHKIMGIGDI